MSSVATSITAPTIVALLPMKHESKRVPNKNHRDFNNGKPLFHSVLKAINDSKYITKTLVDTDSPVIMEYIAEHFPDVMVIARPDHLLNDPPMTEILVHDSSCIEADYFFQTHSTNPFLSTATIDDAIGKFLGEDGRAYNSLFSVNQLQTRLYDELGRAMNHNPNVLLRTQDLPPVYEENSCMYVFPRDVLLKRHSRIGDRAMMYVMKNRVETVDIDTMEDWNHAQHLLAQGILE
jgi:CMP-N-acetylneuraminic acid synthetase